MSKVMKRSKIFTENEDYLNSLIHMLSYRDFMKQDFQHIFEYLTLTHDFNLNLNHVIIEDINYLPFIFSLAFSSLYVSDMKVKETIRETIESHLKVMRMPYHASRDLFHEIFKMVSFYDMVKINNEFPFLYSQISTIYTIYTTINENRNFTLVDYHSNILDDFIHYENNENSENSNNKEIKAKYQILYLILFNCLSNLGDLSNKSNSIDRILNYYNLTRNQIFEILIDMININLDISPLLKKFKNVKIDDDGNFSLDDKYKHLFTLFSFIDYISQNYETINYKIQIFICNFITNYYINCIIDDYNFMDEFPEVSNKLIRFSSELYIKVFYEFICKMEMICKDEFNYEIKNLKRNKYSKNFNFIFDCLYFTFVDFNKGDNTKLFDLIMDDKFIDFRSFLFFEQECLFHFLYPKFQHKGSMLGYFLNLYNSNALSQKFISQVFKTVDENELIKIFGSSYNDIKSSLLEYKPKYKNEDAMIEELFKNIDCLKIEKLLNEDAKIYAKKFVEDFIQKFYDRCSKCEDEYKSNHDAELALIDELEKVSKAGFFSLSQSFKIKQLLNLEIKYHREVKKRCLLERNQINQNEKQMIKLLIKRNLISGDNLEEILEILINSSEDQSEYEANLISSIDVTTKHDIFKSIPHCDG